MSFLKNFLNWFELKPKLDGLVNRPQFSQSEVWNCHFGMNIGFEIDGKNSELLRPVLILKKFSHTSFLGIPLTTKLKNGSWYFPSKVKQIEGRFIFSQAKTIDAKRLYNRIEKIDSNEFIKIKNAFKDFI